jgi:two-component system, chemotaxis family, protein-glutamate methylesterase/glutaminase
VTAAERVSALPEFLVVIAGSAGSLAPLCQLVHELGRELDAAVLIVIHFPPWERTALPVILARETLLPVTLGVQGEPLRAGHVYVAPPGYHHVRVRAGRILLQPQPRHFPRGKSADPLFTSAAAEFGSHALGVVLSGANRNGAAGMAAIKAAGGRTLVQDPAEAAFDTMPRAARECAVDLCASAPLLGRYLAEVCKRR